MFKRNGWRSFFSVRDTTPVFLSRQQPIHGLRNNLKLILNYCCVKITNNLKNQSHKNICMIFKICAH
ncbi:SKP1 family protein, partial [Enterobacter cloacae complex sp. S3]|uniref:SKP1 family protein n=1 Tax=Enterobacter cloacae complex sp. S3 TaxID=2779537 RepID=UPI001D0503FB